MISMNPGVNRRQGLGLGRVLLMLGTVLSRKSPLKTRITFQSCPLEEPIGHGCEPGTSDAITAQAAATVTKTAVARPRMRLRSVRTVHQARTASAGNATTA